MMASKLRSFHRRSTLRSSTRTSKKYVVLMGDVGTGKSTIVEKVTGTTGRSSDAAESATKTAQYFHSTDNNLIICDTPGSNSMANTFMQNMWIAEAMNLQPLSKILITVQAHTRIDNVVKAVDEYAQRFLDMEEELLGVIVTHMDTVEWTTETCKEYIYEHLGITDIIFSGKDEKGKNLCRNIIGVCKKEYNLHVDEENFLKLFKISDKKQKIARSTKRQVDDFKALKDEFYEERKQFESNLKDMTDLIFEFQAWMKLRIDIAEKEVANENAFSFYGESANNEIGHIANMKNQLAVILKDLRIEALGYQADQDVNQLRRCPHCNCVWAKVEGCNEETHCGARPDEYVVDVREGSNCILGTFTFAWDKKKLKIIKGADKRIIPQNTSERLESVGCGKIISWKNMTRVDVPPEFLEKKPANVDDIELVPEAAKSTWKTNFKSASNQVKESMKKQNEEEQNKGASTAGDQLTSDGAKSSWTAGLKIKSITKTSTKLLKKKK